jgi:ketosteroid isomerase-like protein
MGDPQQFIEQLEQATNAHDLEALVACFAVDYRNETPLHPARGFVGRDQVRTNWELIFAFVPDVQSRVLHQVVDGDTIWSEWEMTGTRADGTAHHLRGVILFGVDGGMARWARFYLEPVDEGSGGVTQAVREQVARQ